MSVNAAGSDAVVVDGLSSIVVEGALTEVDGLSSTVVDGEPAGTVTALVEGVLVAGVLDEGVVIDGAAAHRLALRPRSPDRTRRSGRSGWVDRTEVRPMCRRSRCSR